MAGEGNGTIEHSGTVSTLTLTLDHATFELKIGGNVANHDCALAMLQQAARYFETLLRQQAALQLQQQYAEQQRGARIAERVIADRRH